MIATIETDCFDLAKTVQCAQAFRWKQEEEGRFFGVAFGHPVLAWQEGDQLFLDMPSDQEAFWTSYFDLSRNYYDLEKLLSNNEQTAACIPYSTGIHLLKQEPFETLISFIISANNHFSRICGLVEKISWRYGEHKETLGKEFAVFPTPQQLALATEEDLRGLGIGYRAEYILKSSKKVAEGFDLFTLYNQSYAETMKELQTFSGVGPKVANCIALFAFGFGEAFPVDVWVKRVLEHLYPTYSTAEALQSVQKIYGSWAGAAQQYLFHYARMIGLGKEK